MPDKGLLPGHGLFVSIIKYLAEKEIDNGNKPAMLELLNSAIAKLKSENLPEQTAELQIAKMKNFAKMNDIFQVIKVVDEILAKHLDNDKLLVAAAETMIRLNQKSEAKKVCEAGLKFAKAKNKSDLVEFFTDMLKSASK
jgi:thioredoxin-like negative regulator of GroEL